MICSNIVSSSVSIFSAAVNSQGYSLRTDRTITLEKIIFKICKIVNTKCVIKYKYDIVNKYRLPKIKKLKNWNIKHSLDKELNNIIKNRLMND